ncbi:PAAR domain-containing protein [Variovorax sp. OV329]|uniref:PAAR domain-containing protein n=1 Tax=Variovorax sp. OV329 TaxID=1882825 RepID=UPI000B83F3BB|nr:PAAR domain-containing protein [Variovorax sp. OV329]
MASFGRLTFSNGKSQSVVGDKTTHGGVAISGTDAQSWNDLPVLKLGDLVFCPVHGVNKIIEGLPSNTWNGIPLCYDGCKTECGSQLIAEQAPARTLLVAKRTLEFAEGGTHDLQFKVIVESSQKAFAFLPYKVTLDDGREYHGVTDIFGMTNSIYADAPQVATIEVPFYGDKTSTTDSDSGSSTCCR